MPRTRRIKSGKSRAGRYLKKAVAALRKLPKPRAVERREPIEVPDRGRD